MLGFPGVSDEREIDPELVRLRRRWPAGPLLVASVLGFALLLLVRLRHDLAFAGEPALPVDLGRVAGRAAPLPDNAHVAIAGELDARFPGRQRGSYDAGFRLAPLLGTGGRVWVREPGEAIEVTPRTDGRFVGRLRLLDETRFAGDLRAYVAGLQPQPQVILPAALSADGLPATDVHGDPLRAAGDARVTLVEKKADTARVTVVQTDNLTDSEAARLALEAAGLTGLTPVENTAASYEFEVAGSAADANARLRAAKLFSAEAEPKRVVHEGTAGALRLDGDAVVLGAARVPRAAVTHVTVYTPPVLPDDAWVLLSGDTPAGLWYMRPLYGLLGLIALLMIWALVVDLRHLERSKRNQREPRADSPV
jgi:hypothetical protein